MTAPERRTRPEWEPIGGAAHLWEDLDKEWFPRRTAPSGHRNGLPESRGYVYDPAGRAREAEVNARLEAIREQIRQRAGTPNDA
jgi:hypothetical protein